MPERPGHAASDQVAAQVVRRIAHRHLLLLTDYDGTLAALTAVPGDAWPDAGVRRGIARIVDRPMVTFGVVSGRRLDDVRERVGPAASFVAGLHGLEIAGPDVQFRHEALDAAAPVIATLAAEAARVLAWCPSVYLENKTFALTCHVRRVPDAQAGRALAEFSALAQPYRDAGVLRVLRAAKALELLPQAEWNKGRAVEWIRGRVEAHTGRPVSVVYLGDDRTDEDASAALGQGDVMIGVGRGPHPGRVDWRLAGPASVGRFFERLADAWP